MQVNELKVEGLEREFEVIVPAAELSSITETKLKDLSTKVSLPGFRPGKVPFSLVKDKYLNSVFLEVAQNKLQSSVESLVQEKKFALATTPDIGTLNMKLGEDLKFILKLELRPEFELPKFSEMSFAKVTVSLSNNEIEETKAMLRKARAKKVVVTDLSAVTIDGDFVKIDFKGFKAGTPFDGGEAKDFELTLGSGSMIPGFEEQIIGKKVGDEFTIDVTFPAEYHASDLAGAKTTFEIKINQISRLDAPEWNQELAKAMNLETLEKLEEFAKELAQRKYEESCNLITKIRLFNKIDQALDFALPKTMVDRECENLWKQLEQDGEAQAEDKENYAKVAKRRVKVGLVVAEYARVNNIVVNDQDLQNVLTQQARSMNLADSGFKMMVDYYRKNQDALLAIRDSVLESKAVKEILDKEVKFTTQTVSFKELEVLLEKEADSALW